eukprot:2807131-Prymnesium_polylepis.1
MRADPWVPSAGCLSYAILVPKKSPPHSADRDRITTAWAMGGVPCAGERYRWQRAPVRFACLSPEHMLFRQPFTS